MSRPIRALALLLGLSLVVVLAACGSGPKTLGRDGAAGSTASNWRQVWPSGPDISSLG